ncbi:ABC transporter permease [Acidobacteriota bacterium]
MRNHSHPGQNAVAPPRMALWLLKKILRSGDFDFASGDLIETFEILVENEGINEARRWFRKEVVKSLPDFLRNTLHWRVFMILNYIRVGMRILKKNKAYSFINITGLAVGMACSLLIFLWVDNQVNYDKSQVNANRIWRVERGSWADMPTVVGAHIKDLPEIEQIVRFYSRKTPLITHKNFMAEVKDFVFTEPAVFDVFTLPFVQGHPETALNAPNSLVLTEGLAHTIFGNEDPIGQIVRYENKFTFTVTGVIEDVEKFHVRINALASFNSLGQILNMPNFMEDHQWWYPTYLLLNNNVDIIELNRKVQKRLEDRADYEDEYKLIAFKEIYFGRKAKYETGTNHGNKQMVFFFTAVAFLILLIACVNFINMTTAQSASRSKEVSVRKIVGAARRNIMKQFMSEIGLIISISLVLSLILISLFQPVFNTLVGEELQIDYMNPKFILFIMGVFAVTGVLAGLYPAAYLSSFSPNSLLQGRKTRQHRHSPVRRLLVIFQFAISIFLVVGTLTVLNQIQYMKNVDLGFSGEQVIKVDVKGTLKSGRMWLFKNRLLKDPGIKGVSFSNVILGAASSQNPWVVNGVEKQMDVVYADPDFIELMGIEILEGRDLDWKRQTDVARKYLINQEAVSHLGLDNPVGSTVKANFGQSNIIGVVKDFHFQSLHNKIGPIAITWYPPWAQVVNIKITGQNTQKTIDSIRQVWLNINPGFPFSYSFLEETIGRQYQSEGRMAETMKYFTFLSLLLAYLGLFGLTSVLTEQRIKEIGIRKALGASLSSILLLLSREFSKWILLANIIAWPLAYYLLHGWLQNFAYRTGISIWIFLLSGFLSIIIGLITVSSRALKAAASNPVNALRYE